MTTTMRLGAATTILCLWVTQLSQAWQPTTVTTGPDGWQAEVPRQEIAPTFHSGHHDDALALAIAGSDNPSTYGWWARDYEVTAGRSYRFEVDCITADLALPRRSVLVRLTRFNANGKKIRQPEYPTVVALTGTGRTTVAGTYDMPDGSAHVRVEMILRWAPGGRVEWHNPRLIETESTQPRTVRIVTVRYRPGRRTAGPDENRKLFGEMIDKAALEKPDIIVLGEGITVVATGRPYVDVAEPVPGPTTTFLADRSRKHDCYIVAGVYERDGSLVHNTALLVGPEGKLVGKYRKTCLPREESRGGLVPGTEYPVFPTRFGKVGMMICWDVHFPEVARRLAINGAELICLPIWGGNEKLAQARAIENQVFVVTSSYNPNIRSAIFDPYGDALAVATDDDPIAVAEIDLNRQYLHPYLGDFKARIERERPPLDRELPPAE
jgi:predicted amidohydrolase